MTWAPPRSRSHRLRVHTVPSVGVRPSSSPVIRARPLAAGEGGAGPAVGARGSWKACNRECCSCCWGGGGESADHFLPAAWLRPRHVWANCDLEEAAGPGLGHQFFTLPASPPSAPVGSQTTNPCA